MGGKLFACLAALLVLGSVSACAPGKEESSSPGMTQARLQAILQEMAEERQAKIEGDFVDFRFAGVKMACISDPGFDRMRIIAPVADVKKLSAPVLHRLLEANFSSTIDARYATLDGTLYAAYLHPLSSLEEDEVRAAVQQVASLVETYGTSYSSGGLQFGGQDEHKSEIPREDFTAKDRRGEVESPTQL